MPGGNDAGTLATLPQDNMELPEGPVGTTVPVNGD